MYGRCKLPLGWNTVFSFFPTSVVNSLIKNSFALLINLCMYDSLWSYWYHLSTLVNARTFWNKTLRIRNKMNNQSKKQFPFDWVFVVRNCWLYVIARNSASWGESKCLLGVCSSCGMLRAARIFVCTLLWKDQRKITMDIVSMGSFANQIGRSFKECALIAKDTLVMFRFPILWWKCQHRQPLGMRCIICESYSS